MAIKAPKFMDGKSALAQRFVSGNFYGKTVKRRKDGVCKHCEIGINKGDEALIIIIEQRDGFGVKFIALCHIDCFENMYPVNKK